MPGHFRRNCGGRAAFADDTVLFVLRRPDKLGCAVALFGGQFGGLERDADTNVMFGLQGLRDAVGQHLRILRCGFGGRLHRSFVRQFRGSSPAGFCDDVPLGVGAVDDALLKPYPGRALRFVVRLGRRNERLQRVGHRLFVRVRDRLAGPKESAVNHGINAEHNRAG